MVLRNQQTDALNFVKFFHEKAPFCEENPRTKGGCIRLFRQEAEKEGFKSRRTPPKRL